MVLRAPAREPMVVADAPMRAGQGLSALLLLFGGIALFVWSELAIPDVTAAFGSADGDRKAWLQILGVAAAALGLVWILLLLATSASRQQRQVGLAFTTRMRALAAANGWHGSAPLTAEPGFEHAAADGRPRRLGAVAGSVAGLPVSASVEQSAAGMVFLNGQNRLRVVFTARYDMLLPHTLVLPLDGPGARLARSLDRTFDDDQRVSLEGDLDRHFLFFTPRRTVVDALALWTPDVLWALRESLRDVGAPIVVETVGHDLVVAYDGGAPLPPEQLEQLERVFAVLATRVRTAAAFEPLQHADDEYPRLTSRGSGGVVRIGGAAVPLLYPAAVGGFALCVWRFRLLWDGEPTFWIASALTALVFVGVVLLMRRRR